MKRDNICVCAQLCPTLCNPMDCSPLGSSVCGIFQVRILEWVVISYSRGSPDSGIKSMSLVSPALAGRFFTTPDTWEAQRDDSTSFKKKNFFLKKLNPVYWIKAILLTHLPLSLLLTSYLTYLLVSYSQFLLPTLFLM